MPISSVGKTSLLGRPGFQPAAAFRRRPSAARGITLIELLVVVAIIGVLAGISYPSIASGIDSVRMRSATDSVSSILNNAVDHADRRQQPVEIVIAARDNSISLVSNEPGFQRHMQLPGGITIEAIYPQIPDEDGPRRLMVMPGAAVPAIGVQLVNEHGARRRVRLDPMTGFPRVETVSEEK